MKVLQQVFAASGYYECCFFKCFLEETFCMNTLGGFRRRLYKPRQNGIAVKDKLHENT